MKVWGLLGIMCVAIVGMFLPTAEASCWMSGPRPPLPGDTGSCNYNGWVIASGSQFEAPAPFCERCSCHSGGGLSCCGYGWKGGPVGIPGCKAVHDSNSCDWRFVDVNDETQPCPHLGK